MKLIYKNDYISIKQFAPVEISEFSILTGLNGSGKTHLLSAINNGLVEIEGISNSEIVYYNYNDFAVITGAVNSSPQYQERRNKWRGFPNNILQRISEINTSVVAYLENEIPESDKGNFQLFRRYWNFRFLFKHPREIELFYHLRGEKDVNAAITSFGFSMEFEMFIRDLFQNNIDLFYEIDFEQLRLKHDEYSELVEQEFKKRDENLYNYVKSFIRDKHVMNIDGQDLDNPDFLLDDIANEEKEYQFNKLSNTYNKLKAQDLGENVEYLELKQFLEINGLSPIEQINDVLREFDCNGYFLTSNKFDIPLGVSKDQITVGVSLINKIGAYSTSFDQLSSGERTLIALSLLIYKSRRKKIIPRVLLLDEIDSSLHPSMIQRLLDVIQEIFVKKHSLKIILATHSPTTVALSPDSSIYVVNKTGSDKIVKQDKSSAIKILSEGFASLSMEDTNLGIQYNLSNSNLPVLFTEGITDKIIIDTAWKKLYPNVAMPFYIQDCFSAGFLANVFLDGSRQPDGFFNSYQDRRFIALFDFDTEGYNCWARFKNNVSQIEDDPMKCFTKRINKTNGYLMLLPVPNNEEIKSQVIKNGKETLEEKSVLMIESLFYGVEQLDKHFTKEMYPGGNTVVKFKGVDKKGFAEKLKNLDKACFNSFIPLFDKIKEILK